MKSILQKPPKIEKLPSVGKLPNLNLFSRTLQGHRGILSGPWGQWAQKIRPTKDNGGK